MNPLDRAHRFLWAAAVVLAAARSAEPGQITISGPARIAVGAYAFFQVVGLEPDDPARTTVSMTGVSADGKPIPSENITCIPFSGWGGGHTLFVVANMGGRYTITATVNSWRASLDRAVTDAAAARIDAVLLGELRACQDKASGAYPYRSGSATLEVVGANPPPPPPPPPPEVGKRWIFLFYETRETTPALSLQILRLRTSEYLLDKGHKFRPLDKDLPEPAGWISTLGLTPPCLVITELRADGSAGPVLYKGPVPSTYEQTLELVRQHGG